MRADLESILSSFDLADYSAVVLGCTHFIWYRDLFSELLPDGVEVLDGNAATVRQLMRKLTGNICDDGEGSLAIHLTGKRREDVMNFLEEVLPVNFSEIPKGHHG